MKNIFILLISFFPLLGAQNNEFKDFPSYSHGKISIYKKIVGKNFDPDFPTKAKYVPVDEVVRNSEKFLKKAFGKEFHATIRKITFDRHMGNDDEFVWCWVVTYYDPDVVQDIRSARIFHVYLDVNAMPLMEIKQSDKQ